MSKREQKHKVLYVSPSAIHRMDLENVFHAVRYEVVSCMNVDHAIAFCIDNSVSALVLDSEFLTEQDWYAVPTFKSICAGVPILVLADNHHEKIPRAVDAVAGTPALVLQELRQLIGS